MEKVLERGEGGVKLDNATGEEMPRALRSDVIRAFRWDHCEQTAPSDMETMSRNVDVLQ